jgi:hypothetical protein
MFPNTPEILKTEESREEHNRTIFKNGLRNKETTSTLLESIQSVNSIKEKLVMGDLINLITPMKKQADTTHRVSAHQTQKAAPLSTNLKQVIYTSKEFRHHTKMQETQKP